MGRSLSQPLKAVAISEVPIGAIAPVFRSGLAYKAVGEFIKRADYPALSEAFPRDGSISSVVRNGVGGYLAYGAGTWVAIGITGGLATSPDGISWTNRMIMYTPEALSFAGVVFGGGKFVAWTSGGVTNYVCHSVDGINWSVTNIRTGQWRSAAYGGGKFVLIASGNNNDGTGGANLSLVSSDGGVTWVTRALPTASDWASIAYNGTVFVALSTSNSGTTAVSSPDGINWTARVLPYATGWRSISANPAGRFVAVGKGLITATSMDGVTWTPSRVSAVAIPGVEEYGFSGVDWANGVWVACCYAYGGTTNHYYTSTDGITWHQRFSPAAMHSSSSINGRVVAGPGYVVLPNVGSGSLTVYPENTTDSEYMYLSGNAGQFIRVK